MDRDTPEQHIDLVVLLQELARGRIVVEQLTERVRGLEDEITRLKHHMRWDKDAD